MELVEQVGESKDQIRRYIRLIEHIPEILDIVDKSLIKDKSKLQMVESNLYREYILQSEKAFSYKMRMDAMKRTAGRPQKENSSPVGIDLRGKQSLDLMSEECGDSRNQIHRYIRLTELISEILDMVDNSVIKDKSKLQMVESNLHREYILPSENAFSYKMRLEAMKRQVGRPRKNNSDPVGPNLLKGRSNDELSAETGDGTTQIKRYIRLTELIPEILDMVDNSVIKDKSKLQMVESNLHREYILPSEKAFSYKMRMDAMKRTAGRPSKENLTPVVSNFNKVRTNEQLGEEVGESREQIRRYIRLTELIPEILDMVDNSVIKDKSKLQMVESNLHREYILPSEKAFSYKMRLEAMKRTAGRPSKENGGPVGHNLDRQKSRDILAADANDSARQIQRYIRLTELIPEILDMVDNSVIKDKSKLQMVESNLHREYILPSENAFSYKMRMEAMNKQGCRTDLTSTPVVSKLRTNEQLGEEVGESREQIRRYIRLTELIPEILDIVDNSVIKDKSKLQMVESNLHREYILPSEKAFSYKMRLEAMKRQGQRSDLTSSPLGMKLRGKHSLDLMSEDCGDSRNQIRRYIRLTELIHGIFDIEY